MKRWAGKLYVGCVTLAAVVLGIIVAYYWMGDQRQIVTSLWREPSPVYCTIMRGIGYPDFTAHEVLRCNEAINGIETHLKRTKSRTG